MSLVNKRLLPYMVLLSLLVLKSYSCFFIGTFLLSFLCQDFLNSLDMLAQGQAWVRRERSTMPVASLLGWALSHMHAPSDKKSLSFPRSFLLSPVFQRILFSAEGTVRASCVFNCKLKMSAWSLKFVDLYGDPFVHSGSGVESFPFRNRHISFLVWETHSEDLSSGGMNTLELSPQSPGHNTYVLSSSPSDLPISWAHSGHKETHPSSAMQAPGNGYWTFLPPYLMPSFLMALSAGGLWGFSPGGMSERSGI